MPSKEAKSLTQRLGWLDSLKGVSILAVVIGHIATPLSTFIYVWHIPFFFFLSGNTHKPDQQVWPYILKQVKTLLIPYFIFGLLGIAAELLKRTLLPGFAYTNEQLSLVEYFAGLFIKMSIEALPHYGFVLWFLIALFWTKILALLLTKVHSEKLVIGLALTLFIIGYSFPNFPFGFPTGLLGLLWYISGTLSTKLRLPLFENKAVLLLFFATSWLVAVFSAQSLTMNLAYRQIPHLNASILVSIAICLSTTMAAKQFFSEGNRWLSWLGKRSLTLLIIHPYLNNLSYFFTTIVIDLPWYVDVATAVLLNLFVLVALEYGSEYYKKICDQLHHSSVAHRLQSQRHHSATD